VNGVTITWETLLVAVILAAIIYLLETMLFNRRRKPTGQPDAVRDLDLDVEGLHNRVSELERSMRALREQLAEQQAVQDKSAKALADREALLEATPYAQAAQLARQGASPQELARRCGITNGEAELIVALNRGES
jgi:uncharacterized protein YlxW (UPF0749 family)